MERREKTKVKNLEFNLAGNQKYYLLIASGSGLRPFSVDYHDIVRSVSDKPMSLSEISNVASKSKILIKLHGCFMILAWIGFGNSKFLLYYKPKAQFNIKYFLVPIAIALARYFKQMWSHKSICGKDIWFAVRNFKLFICFYIKFNRKNFSFIDF